DVWVREPRHRLRLAHHARAQLLAAAEVGADELERDLPVELRVVRGVDHAHAAGADDIHDDVAADALAARRRAARGAEGGRGLAGRVGIADARRLLGPLRRTLRGHSAPR